MYKDPSVEVVDYMGSDISVVNAARVSFSRQVSAISPRDIGLLQYLARNNHWSPFAHTSIQLRVKAPVFIARQLAKHMVGGVWNEVSRRYVDTDVTFFRPKSWREAAENKKQGSGDDIPDHEAIVAHEAMDSVYSLAMKAYDKLVNEIGVAPEQARMILPQGMMTEWIWTGSLAFWARVCKQRMSSHAQAEVRSIARLIGSECRKLFPHSWAALMESYPLDRQI